MDLEGWFVFGTRISSKKTTYGLRMSRHETSPFTIVQGAWQYWWGTDSDLDLKEGNVQLKSYKGWNSFSSLPNGLTCLFSSWDHLSSEVKILGVKNHRLPPPRKNSHGHQAPQPSFLHPNLPKNPTKKTRSVTELDGIFGIAQITPSEGTFMGNWEGAPFSVYIFAGFFFPVT